MQSAIASASCPSALRAAAGQPSTSGCPYRPCRVFLHSNASFLRGSHSAQLQRIRGSVRQQQRYSQIVRSVSDVTEDNFEAEVLKADVPVLVDFWATWCGPCKLIAPLLDQLEKEFAGDLKIVKVEADPCPNLVEKYKALLDDHEKKTHQTVIHSWVYGLPTLVLFKDGEVVKGSQKEGALGKPVILKYLETYGVLPQTAQ